MDTCPACGSRISYGKGHVWCSNGSPDAIYRCCSRKCLKRVQAAGDDNTAFSSLALLSAPRPPPQQGHRKYKYDPAADLLRAPSGEPEPEAAWQSLSVGVLELLAQCLPLPDLLNAALTCRHWHTALTCTVTHASLHLTLADSVKHEIRDERRSRRALQSYLGATTRRRLSQLLFRTVVPGDIEAGRADAEWAQCDVKERADLDVTAERWPVVLPVARRLLPHVERLDVTIGGDMDLSFCGDMMLPNIAALSTWTRVTSLHITLDRPDALLPPPLDDADEDGRPNPHAHLDASFLHGKHLNPMELDHMCIGALGRLTRLTDLSLDVCLKREAMLNGLSTLTALTRLEIKHVWTNCLFYDNWPSEPHEYEADLGSALSRLRHLSFSVGVLDPATLAGGFTALTRLDLDLVLPMGKGGRPVEQYQPLADALALKTTLRELSISLTPDQYRWDLEALADLKPDVVTDHLVEVLDVLTPALTTLHKAAQQAPAGGPAAAQQALLEQAAAEAQQQQRNNMHNSGGRRRQRRRSFISPSMSPAERAARLSGGGIAPAAAAAANNNTKAATFLSNQLNTGLRVSFSIPDPAIPVDLHSDLILRLSGLPGLTSLNVSAFVSGVAGNFSKLGNLSDLTSLEMRFSVTASPTFYADDASTWAWCMRSLRRLVLHAPASAYTAETEFLERLGRLTSLSQLELTATPTVREVPLDVTPGADADAAGHGGEPNGDRSSAAGSSGSAAGGAVVPAGVAAATAAATAASSAPRAVSWQSLLPLHLRLLFDSPQEALEAIQVELDAAQRQAEAQAAAEAAALQAAMAMSAQEAAAVEAQQLQVALELDHHSQQQQQAENAGEAPAATEHQQQPAAGQPAEPAPAPEVPAPPPPPPPPPAPELPDWVLALRAWIDNPPPAQPPHGHDGAGDDGDDDDGGGDAEGGRKGTGGFKEVLQYGPPVRLVGLPRSLTRLSLSGFADLNLTVPQPAWMISSSAASASSSASSPLRGGGSYYGSPLHGAAPPGLEQLHFTAASRAAAARVAAALAELQRECMPLLEVHVGVVHVPYDVDDEGMIIVKPPPGSEEDASEGSQQEEPHEGPAAAAAAAAADDGEVEAMQGATATATAATADQGQGQDLMSLVADVEYLSVAGSDDDDAADDDGAAAATEASTPRMCMVLLGGGGGDGGAAASASCNSLASFRTAAEEEAPPEPAEEELRE